MGFRLEGGLRVFQGSETPLESMPSPRHLDPEPGSNSLGQQGLGNGLHVCIGKPALLQRHLAVVETFRAHFRRQARGAKTANQRCPQAKT